MSRLEGRCLLTFPVGPGTVPACFTLAVCPVVIRELVYRFPPLLRKVLDLLLSELESGSVVIAVGFLTVTLRETLRGPGI